MGELIVNQTTVVCVGELIIDMFCTDKGVSLTEGVNFKKQPGGAPANVSVTVSKMGGTSVFVGKVGNDSFGEFLINTLKSYSVDTTMVKKDNHFPTTMAFVSLTNDGNNDFQFNRGADKYLSIDDVQFNAHEKKIVHFGSATALLDDPLKKTYLDMLKKSYEKNDFISFDPNYRHDLWQGNEQLFIERARKIIAQANFVKTNHDEIMLLTNENELEAGVKKLHQLGAEIIAITLGEQGALLSNGNKLELIPSKSIKAVDPTGAGDAFVGAVLYQFAQLIDQFGQVKKDDFPRLEEIIRFANDVGAKVCTQIGSLTAIPENV